MMTSELWIAAKPQALYRPRYRADSGDYNLAFIHSNLFYNTMFSINIIQIYRLYFFLLAFRLIYFIASHTPDKETNVPPNMVPHITIFHKTG